MPAGFLGVGGWWDRADMCCDRHENDNFDVCPFQMCGEDTEDGRRIRGY